jgi:hypothetical protein
MIGQGMSPTSAAVWKERVSLVALAGGVFVALALIAEMSKALAYGIGAVALIAVLARLITLNR